MVHRGVLSLGIDNGDASARLWRTGALPTVRGMSSHTPPHTPAGRAVPQRALGLPVWALAALSLLAAPRVVLHDLGVGTGGPVAGLLTVVPAGIWIAVAVRARTPRPLVTLLVVGLFYGVILAAVHNLLWDRVFEDVTPRLGGNLEGALSSGAEEVVMRIAMTVSSVFTGAAVGLVCGLLAMVVLAMLNAGPARRSQG